MGIFTVIGAVIIVAQGLHTVAEWLHCRKVERIKIRRFDGGEA
jgi:hypothetical protein